MLRRRRSSMYTAQSKNCMPQPHGWTWCSSLHYWWAVDTSNSCLLILAQVSSLFRQHGVGRFPLLVVWNPFFSPAVYRLATNGKIGKPMVRPCFAEIPPLLEVGGVETKAQESRDLSGLRLILLGRVWSCGSHFFTTSIDDGSQWELYLKYLLSQR